MKNPRLVDRIYRDLKSKKVEDAVVDLLADPENTVAVEEADRHNVERIKRRVRKEHGLPVWYQGVRNKGVRLTILWTTRPEEEAAPAEEEAVA